MSSSASQERRPTAALWRRYQKARDCVLRNRILEAYLPLVSAVAARVAHRLPPCVELEDLKSVGVLGLLNAIDHFDVGRGVQFEAFSKKRIAGAMLDELRRQDWIPREARDRVEALRSAKQELRDRFGREASDFELARCMNLSLRAVHDITIELTLTNMMPLDTSDEDSGNVHRFDLANEEPEPYERAFQSELLSLVDSHLDSTEKNLVRWHYHDSKPLRLIGNNLRLSESRVCQLHNRMLTRLKARLYQEVAP